MAQRCWAASYPIITNHYDPIGLRDQQRMLVYEGEAISDSFTSTNSCTERCIEVFYDCAAETDCRNLESCQSDALSCARTC